MASNPLEINSRITIAGWELTEQFVLAGGPGGQNVNKVSTAVQLFFDIANSPSLPERVKTNALKLAGKRVSKDGVLMIEASRSRSQERNREEARERLKELILEAAKPPPPPRKATKPTKGSVERRLKAKSGRSDIKKMRGRPWASDFRRSGGEPHGDLAERHKTSAGFFGPAGPGKPGGAHSSGRY